MAESGTQNATEDIIDVHAEAIRINQIKHFQTMRDRISHLHPAPDSAVIDVLHMHAIVEDRRRARRDARAACSDPTHNHGPDGTRPGVTCRPSAA